MKFLTPNNTFGSSRENSSRNSGCKRLRQQWLGAVGRQFSIRAPWVQRHVATCPRCRRRLAGLGRIDLALSIIKSQPQHLDLLKRANTAAVKMLKHGLREAPQARVLENTQPEPSFLERLGIYRNYVTSLAACLAILVLVRTELPASFGKMNTGGEELMKQYYSHRAGTDLADEVFDT